LTDFTVINNLKSPKNEQNKYKSYYCECKNGYVGVNCEFQQNQCNSVKKYWLTSWMRQQSLTKYSVNTLGNVDNNSGTKCDKSKGEFCYPLLNGIGYQCLPSGNSNQPNKPGADDIVNYLVFDQSNINSDDRLNLSDAGTVMKIQDFIRDEVLPRYSYNDYSKIPKGPLAIMRPSVNMPDILNGVVSKINSIINSQIPDAANILDDLINSRIQQIIKDTLLYLIASGKLPQNGDTLDQTIDKVIQQLKIQDIKLFSPSQWNLIINSLPDEIKTNDPTALISHLEALKNNSDALVDFNKLNDVLTLRGSNKITIDLDNYTNRPYTLLRADILLGIYSEPDGNLSIRPTPGLFLASQSTDDSSPPELIFLPGLFNPASSSDCSINSLFMPGIMSLPIDQYNINSLTQDPTQYLNKFIPMQLPFNLNGFLTSRKVSLADNIVNILTSPNNGALLNNSQLLFTPIDFDANTKFDIINNNDKFMTNLFTAQDASLYKVVNEQTQFPPLDLASTQVLSNPTELPVTKQNALNDQCINLKSKPKYSPNNGQFYDVLQSSANVSTLPFILYDDDGNPIPSDVVEKAIIKYCQNYQGI
jgi:hypothetical protein